MAAARLMYEHGVVSTSVDSILRESGTGKSQFYLFFSGKNELIAEVLRHQLGQILGEEHRSRLASWADVDAWLGAAVAGQQARDFRGCPLGSIASEAAEQGGELRAIASEAFTSWESAVAQKLELLQSHGLLHRNTDIQALAETMVTILEGGYLLSTVKRDIRPMRHAAQAARSELERSAR